MAGNGFCNRIDGEAVLPINLPNLITLARILAVPLTIWLIVSGAYMPAFITFIAAGISDAVDGFIAKRFNLQTELGAYLDPIADKLLLVGIYVSLGLLLFLPAWLVILVASRDFLIIGGMLLAWLIDRPIEVHPLIISKINTTLQIALAGLTLGILAFHIPQEWPIFWGSAVVGISTVASGAAYIRQWLRHMANGNGVAARRKSD
jgi:cardiolipin synthase